MERKEAVQEDLLKPHLSLLVLPYMLLNVRFVIGLFIPDTTQDKKTDSACRLHCK